jgi:hypothetical protein
MSFATVKKILEKHRAGQTITDQEKRILAEYRSSKGGQGAPLALSNFHCTRQDLMDALQIPLFRFKDLARENILVRVDQGIYDWKQSVSNYLKYRGIDGTKKTRHDNDPADILAERKRLLRIKADREEISLLKDAGKLIDADAAGDFWANALSNFKRNLMSQAGIIARKLSRKKKRDAKTTEHFLEDEFRQILSELSQSNFQRVIDENME